MSRVLLHYMPNGGLAWAAEEGVEVVCVDANCPADRVYATKGYLTAEQFDAHVDAAINNQITPEDLGGGL